ncbi:MAG: hypothetical protein CMB32_04445 [Euryarchaeota archaeon]|nr:hypothetical protein [Euryarchaeota archaeon]
MKSLKAFFVTMLLGFQGWTQLPTWVDDIAPLVHDHCAKCHHEGGAGPFPLMSYEDVFFTASEDLHAMQDGEMPPWPADPNYNHFVGENYLTDEEVATFQEWYETGMAYGDESVVVEEPVFPDGSNLESLDFVAAIPPYTLQSNNEEYRWFVIPTDFEEVKYIQAVEVMPDLEAAVHHADIFVDVTGSSWQYDMTDPLPGFNGSTGWPTNTTYINAWQPGALPCRYPDGWGIPVPPGADLVIEIHYGPDFAGEIDETVMNLEWVDEPLEEIRTVYAGWLLGTGNMTDGPLVIPPNEVVTFHQEGAPFSNDMTILSICPHMHLLGKSYKVWMENPEGDSIPLIDIPQWDFEWQFYYRFLSPVHFPVGSKFFTEGVYDNTSWNEDNPNDPPIYVYNGSLTVDEMFLVYFIYTGYQEGDEDLVFEVIDGVNQIRQPQPHDINIYPNPASSEFTLEAESGDLVVVRDGSGRFVWSGVMNSDIIQISTSGWTSGPYTVEVSQNNHRIIRQIIIE